MATPYGGTIQWGYSSFTNSAGMTQREVSSRSLRTVLNGSAWAVNFSPGQGDSALQLHAQRQVLDSQSGALRNYLFQSDPASPFAGLLTTEQDFNAVQTTNYRTSSYAWSQDPWGHPYVAESDIVLDSGTSSAVTVKTTQAMAADKTGVYGQIVSRSQYGYDNLTTPARTYNYYISQISGGLTPMWRPTWSTLTSGSSTQTLFANNYSAAYNPASGAILHDSSLFASFAGGEATIPRGLRTKYTPYFGDTRSVSTSYDITGNVTYSGRSDGSSVIYTADSANGRYMLPAAATPNANSNLASNFSWATFLGLIQETGPNAVTTTIGYDGAARPSSTRSPDGAVTTYAYAPPTSTTPASVIATTSFTTWSPARYGSAQYSRWTRTLQDGLGRTIQTDTGTGAVSDANSISRVLTVYGPCACTPAGKLTQVSRPFNPNTETPVFTTYTYGALGRITSVIQPANSGSTSYVYAGNIVTVTDPGGRWKKYTSDVFGNVTQVNEPNPAGGSDYITNYTYNQFDKLTMVSMPRTMPGGYVFTQTRTFVYDPQQRLSSVTHPESGKTTYTYDAAGRVATKTDAKGNVITYTYDLYNRITQIARAGSSGTVEPEPTTTFTYDAGDSSGFSFGAPLGHLTKTTHGYGLVERFSYTQSGRLNGKSYTLGSKAPFTQTYGYDTEGHQVMANAPATNGPLYWSYDAFGR